MGAAWSSTVAQPSEEAMAEAPIGIMAAMPVEIEKLKAHVTEQVEHKFGSVFTFTTGKLSGRAVVFASAGVSAEGFEPC